MNLRQLIAGCLLAARPWGGHGRIRCRFGERRPYGHRRRPGQAWATAPVTMTSPAE